jgi:hypothetical protein
MGAYDEFRENILDAHLPLFQQMLHDGSIVFATRPSDEPMTITPPSRRDDLFLDRLMDEFVEIKHTFDRLRDSEIYIRQYPFRTRKLDKVRYLRAMIEAHLNEIYVLAQRLEAMAKFITRAYRRDARAVEIKRSMDEVVTLVQQSLKDVNAARGHHVHRARFQDRELRQLGMMWIVAQRKPDLTSNFETVYRGIKRSKLKWVTDNNALIEKLLDECFKLVDPVVFTRSKGLRPPAVA